MIVAGIAGVLLIDRVPVTMPPAILVLPMALVLGGLAYTSPHGPAVNDPVDDEAARGITYPMPANVCEQDVSDKPAFIRGHPACTRTQTEYDNRMRAQQAKMLASVDRGLGRQ